MSNKPVSKKPASSKPASGKPASSKSASSKPAGGKGGSGRSAASSRARLAEQRAREARRQRERRIVIGVALGLALALVVGGIVWFVVQGQAGKAPARQAPIVEVQQVPENGKPIRFGRADAPKLVELFVDFHCAHCVEFEDRFGATIQEAESQGLVRIEVYSLSFIDAGSVSAANAFACAAVAGFPRAYFNGLYANATQEWTDQRLLALVGRIGKQSTPAFEQCVTGKQQQAWVSSLSAAADARNIQGTPTVFIDGQSLPLQGLTEAQLRSKLGL